MSGFVDWLLGWGKYVHFLAGFITACSVLVHPILVVLGFLGFELYEFLNYFQEADWPTAETEEFMVGFFVAVVLLLFY